MARRGEAGRRDIAGSRVAIDDDPDRSGCPAIGHVLTDRRAILLAGVLVLLGLALAGCGGNSDAAASSDGNDPDPVGATIEPKASATPEEAASSVWFDLAGPKYPYLEADTTEACWKAMGPESHMEAVADRMELLQTAPKIKATSDRAAAEAAKTGEAMVSVSIQRLDLDRMEEDRDSGATSLDLKSYDLEPLVIPPMRYVETDDGWKLDDARCDALEDLLVEP